MCPVRHPFLWFLLSSLLLFACGEEVDVICQPDCLGLMCQ
jgi:hypothetical protein